VLAPSSIHGKCVCLESTSASFSKTITRLISASMFNGYDFRQSTELLSALIAKEDRQHEAEVDDKKCMKADM
jgi:hypothetical protein